MYLNTFPRVIFSKQRGRLNFLSTRRKGETEPCLLLIWLHCSLYLTGSLTYEPQMTDNMIAAKDYRESPTV